ncbi:hypothetical protein Z969_10765 [Clostridium novyi A str. 4570]|uniref:Replication protein n=1 Tax=Clostridium novyi A str. 4570 TaxID=1444290 RepID=A0AA88ZPJ9_CLONO|nr:protein rep [Clostridium novyi]KGM99349.1 hypothetical protein Z969_10765 [Clostridium novyi A str. 4570]
MYNNNNTLENEKQVLKDFTSTGREIDWKTKKERTILLADSYLRLGLKKAYRVKECGSYLEFKKYTDGKLKLNGANFCKDRLCPMCIWRRSLKIFGQVSKVMDRALDIKEYRFIFLTLTCKNVYGEDLNNCLDNMYKAFRKLTERKQFKKSIKGFFRGLEVTHNLDTSSISYDTYHPHFHVILMVNKSYFTDKDYYLSQAKWTELWKDCLKVDYTPIVNVKAFKTGTKSKVAKSVSESAKYTVKDNDYLIENREDLTDSAVMILNSALKGRRLVAFGGELRKIHKELNLGDMEKGDLVNTDNTEEIREDVNYIIERYKWNFGYKQYIKFNLE